MFNVGAAVLWLALVLVGIRSAFLVTMAHVGHDIALPFALRRLASVLTVEVLACAAGALLAIAVLLGLGRRAMALAILLGAVPLFFALSGWPFGDPDSAPGFETTRGQAATACLAAVAIALATWSYFRTRNRERNVGTLAVAVPLLLLIGIPAGFAALERHSAAEMQVVEVVAELFERTDQIETLSGEFSVGILNPASDWRVDGGDMPSLLMPPPASLRYVVPADVGPVYLTAAAGLDKRAADALDESHADSAVRFELSVNGEVRLDETLWSRRAGETVEQTWSRMDAVAIRPGDAVEFRTELVAGPPIALAGFGNVRVERRHAVERGASSPERPNIVLIVMDTLRLDRLETYGYERPTSPNLERLAKRGRVYEEAYSTASFTWPATASILTGLQPTQHGVQGAESCYLTDQIQSVAEALQRQGYSTGAWTGNSLISAERNFDQGFEVFDSTPSIFRKTDMFLSRALDWVEVCDDRRFFLYLHLTEPHTPLEPNAEARALLSPDVPEDFSPTALYQLLWNFKQARSQEQFDEALERVPAEHRRWISDSYDACVRTGDDHLGTILDFLSERGLDDRTLVVFTSDHGEEIFDHGMTSHGQSLYGELVRVPLVIAGPGVRPGERFSTPVSNRHLAPTLAELGGSRISGIPDPLILGPQSPEPRPVMFSTQSGWWNGWEKTHLFGVRSDDHVLHWAPDAGGWVKRASEPVDRLRLFDLSADPGELHNRVAEEPDRVLALRNLLKQREQELEALRLTSDLAAGGSTMDMLKDVGYVGGEDE